MKSIVIPAHNEASLLPRTISHVLADDALSNCDIVVICNGCTDDSVAVLNTLKSSLSDLSAARSVSLHIINEAKASKTHALNVGMNFVAQGDIVLLDADIIVSGRCIERIFEILALGGTKAISPKVNFNTSCSDRFVQMYYQVEQQSEYNRDSRLSNVIGLSAIAVHELGEFPDVIADDEYLRRSFKKDEYRILQSETFDFFVPRNLFQLVKVLARVERGNIQLTQMNFINDDKTFPSSIQEIDLSSRFIFFITKICAKVLARYEYYFGHKNKWHRDLSSR